MAEPRWGPSDQQDIDRIRKNEEEWQEAALDAQKHNLMPKKVPLSMVLGDCKELVLNDRIVSEVVHGTDKTGAAPERLLVAAAMLAREALNLNIRRHSLPRLSTTHHPPPPIRLSARTTELVNWIAGRDVFEPVTRALHGIVGELTILAYCHLRKWPPPEKSAD